jgi:biotin transport system substrate-specific component
VLGLPVFAGTPEKGVGIVYIIGPTGGYIFGYLLSVLVAGKMFDEKEYFNKKNNYFINFIKLLIAILPTYILGLIWLGNVIGWNKPILELGLYPFVLGEFFKISILIILIPKILKFKK